MPRVPNCLGFHGPLSGQAGSVTMNLASYHQLPPRRKHQRSNVTSKKKMLNCGWNYANFFKHESLLFSDCAISDLSHRFRSPSHSTETERNNQRHFAGEKCDDSGTGTGED